MTHNVATPLIIRIFDSDENVELGGFTPTVNVRIKTLLIQIIKVGTAGGSETMTASVYGSTDLTAPLDTSASVALADVETALGLSGSFTNNTPFTMNGLVLNSNTTYYFGLSLSNYTRNGTTFFISVPFHFPDPVYSKDTHLNFTDGPLAFTVFGDIIS